MPRERKKKDDGEGGSKAKKRRTSAAVAAGAGASGQAAGGGQHLPPNYSDNQTLFASNPFDDYPPTGHQAGPPGHMMAPFGGPAPGGAKAGPGPLLSGKVYPADQHRVFNSANPNAPPIYPCGICHKEVNEQDQAILCESGCNFWYHRACTGLTDLAYSLLTEEIYAEWACERCMSKMIPLVKCKP